ncbi:helix-turn-helix domain-containing protein [Sinorhizobium garamanticum]|uniref:helix-turn-helix domain-containing protein n=1 Tax=Sinorhizobium garamanticum TaxID=680247 RepID=UPI003CC8B460
MPDRWEPARRPVVRPVGLPVQQLQVVNEYRIEEAKRLLAQSNLPVTTIIFEAGFQTKSNFNREFLRVTGMSPSDYRRSNSLPSVEGEPISVGSPSPGMP